MTHSIQLQFRPSEHRCAYCHSQITLSRVFGCPSCHILLHEDCWTELGSCPSLGCEGEVSIEEFAETTDDDTSPDTISNSTVHWFLTLSVIVQFIIFREEPLIPLTLLMFALCYFPPMQAWCLWLPLKFSPFRKALFRWLLRRVSIRIPSKINPTVVALDSCQLEPNPEDVLMYSRLLQSEDPFTKLWALKSIAKLGVGGAPAIPELFKVMTDNSADDWLILMAGTALFETEVKIDPYIDTVMSLLRNPSGVRRWLAVMLIRQSEARPKGSVAIIQHLASHDPHTLVREQASAVLGLLPSNVGKQVQFRKKFE